MSLSIIFHELLKRSVVRSCSTRETGHEARLLKLLRILEQAGHKHAGRGLLPNSPKKGCRWSIVIEEVLCDQVYFSWTWMMLHSLHLHNGLVPGDENTSLATRPQPGLRHLEALLLESPQATCSILLVEKTKEEPWIKTQGACAG